MKTYQNQTPKDVFKEVQRGCGRKSLQILEAKLAVRRFTKANSMQLFKGIHESSWIPYSITTWKKRGGSPVGLL